MKVLVMQDERDTSSSSPRSTLRSSLFFGAFAHFKVSSSSL
jgi:hypothetical protein